MTQLARSVVYISGLAVISLGLFSCKKSKEDYSQRVVVRVGTKEIRSTEFAQELSSYLRSYDALTAKDPATVKRTKRMVLEKLIREEILLAWAKKNGVSVEPAEVEKEIQGFRAQYPNDIAFRKSLAEEGLSLDHWEHEMQMRLLEKKVVHTVSGTQKISDSLLREYYLQNKSQFVKKERARLRQIVTAKQLDAESVLGLLKKGEKFEELAKKYSLGPEGARGGSLGWIEKGTLEVFDQAFKLGAKGRTGVLSSPYGFHIIELLEKRAPQNVAFEQAREKISKILSEKLSQDAYNSWFRGEIQKSKIFVDQPLVDAMEITTQ